MALQTEILSTETSDFLEQIVGLMSFNSVFCVFSGSDAHSEMSSSACV